MTSWLKEMFRFAQHDKLGRLTFLNKITIDMRTEKRIEIDGNSLSVKQDFKESITSADLEAEIRNLTRKQKKQITTIDLAGCVKLTGGLKFLKATFPNLTEINIKGVDEKKCKNEVTTEYSLKTPSRFAFFSKKQKTINIIQDEAKPINPNGFSTDKFKFYGLVGAFNFSQKLNQKYNTITIEGAVTQDDINSLTRYLEKNKVDVDTIEIKNCNSPLDLANLIQKSETRKVKILKLSHSPGITPIMVETLKQTNAQLSIISDDEKRAFILERDPHQVSNQQQGRFFTSTAASSSQNNNLSAEEPSSSQTGGQELIQKFLVNFDTNYATISFDDFQNQFNAAKAAAELAGLDIFKLTHNRKNILALVASNLAMATKLGTQDPINKFNQILDFVLEQLFRVNQLESAEERAKDVEERLKNIEEWLRDIEEILEPKTNTTGLYDGKTSFKEYLTHFCNAKANEINNPGLATNKTALTKLPQKILEKIETKKQDLIAQKEIAKLEAQLEAEKHQHDLLDKNLDAELDNLAANEQLKIQELTGIFNEGLAAGILAALEAEGEEAVDGDLLKQIVDEQGNGVFHILATRQWQETDADNINNIVKKIRELGLDINAAKSQSTTPALANKTPLELAVDTSNVLMVQTLLEKGANPNLEDAAGKTILDKVFATLADFAEGNARNLRQEIIRILLEKNAAFKLSDVTEEIIGLLADNQAFQQKFKQEKLKLALHNSKTYQEKLDYLRQTFVDTEKFPNWALEIIDDPKLDLIREALQKLQPNINSSEKTLIEEFALFLINHKATTIIGDADSDKAIHLAANSGNLQLVNAIIENLRHFDDLDTHIDSTNQPKSTALMYVLEGLTLYSGDTTNYIEIIKTLIANGADITKQDSYGFTALSLCLTENFSQNLRPEIVKLLLDKDNITKIINTPRNPDKNTPLHLAVISKNAKLVKLLLEKGANPNLQNNEYETAFDLARKIEDEDIKNQVLDALLYPDGATLTDKIQLALAKLMYFDEEKNRWTKIQQIKSDEVKRFVEEAMEILRDRDVKTDQALADALKTITFGEEQTINGNLVLIDHFPDPALALLTKELKRLIAGNHDNAQSRFFNDGSQRRKAEMRQDGNGDVVNQEDSFLKRGGKQGGAAAVGFEGMLRIATSHPNEDLLAFADGQDYSSIYLDPWLIKSYSEQERVGEKLAGDYITFLIGADKSCETRKTNFTKTNKDGVTKDKFLAVRLALGTSNLQVDPEAGKKKPFLQRIKKHSPKQPFPRDLIEWLFVSMAAGHNDIKGDNVLQKDAGGQTGLQLESGFIVIDFDVWNTAQTTIVQFCCVELTNAIFDNASLKEIKDILSFKKLADRCDTLRKYFDSQDLEAVTIKQQAMAIANRLNPKAPLTKTQLKSKLDQQTSYFDIAMQNLNPDSKKELEDQFADDDSGEKKLQFEYSALLRIAQASIIEDTLTLSDKLLGVTLPEILQALSSVTDRGFEGGFTDITNRHLTVLKQKPDLANNPAKFAEIEERVIKYHDSFISCLKQVQEVVKLKMQRDKVSPRPRRQGDVSICRFNEITQKIEQAPINPSQIITYLAGHDNFLGGEEEGIEYNGIVPYGLAEGLEATVLDDLKKPIAQQIAKLRTSFQSVTDAAHLLKIIFPAIGEISNVPEIQSGIYPVINNLESFKKAWARCDPTIKDKIQQNFADAATALLELSKRDRTHKYLNDAILKRAIDFLEVVEVEVEVEADLIQKLKDEKERRELFQQVFDAAQELHKNDPGKFETLKQSITNLYNITIGEDNNYSDNNISDSDGRSLTIASLRDLPKKVNAAYLPKKERHAAKAEFRLLLNLRTPTEQEKTKLLELAPTQANNAELFFLACQSGNVEVVERMLAFCTNADVYRNPITDTSISPQKTTPLGIACEMGHLDVVKAIITKLDNDAARYVAQLDESGLTPVHRACKNGHVDVALFLLATNNNVANQICYFKEGAKTHKFTPLKIACHFNDNNRNLDLVKALLDQQNQEGNGYLINIYHKTRQKVFGESKFSDELVLAILQRLAQEEIERTKQALDLYDFAARRQPPYQPSLRAIKALIAQGIKYTGNSQETIVLINQAHEFTKNKEKFIAACRSKNQAEALRLIPTGNSLDPECFFIACENGLQEVVNQLIVNGAAINIEWTTSQITTSPLGIACQNGHLEVVNLIINELGVGAEDYIKTSDYIKNLDSSGLSPFHRACIGGDAKVVDALFKTQPIVDIINLAANSRETPLLFACQNNKLEVVEFLLGKGATIDQETINYICNDPNVDSAIVALLIKKWAKNNTTTPFIGAIALDSPLAIKALFEQAFEADEYEIECIQQLLQQGEIDADVKKAIEDALVAEPIILKRDDDEYKETTFDNFIGYFKGQTFTENLTIFRAFSSLSENGCTNLLAKLFPAFDNFSDIEYQFMEIKNRTKFDIAWARQKLNVKQPVWEKLNLACQALCELSYKDPNYDPKYELMFDRAEKCLEIFAFPNAQQWKGKFYEELQRRELTQQIFAEVAKLTPQPLVINGLNNTTWHQIVTKNKTYGILKSANGAVDVVDFSSGTIFQSGVDENVSCHKPEDLEQLLKHLKEKTKPTPPPAIPNPVNQFKFVNEQYDLDTKMMAALKNDNFVEVQNLVNIQGLAIITQSPYLFIACQNNQSDIVKFLLEKGASCWESTDKIIGRKTPMSAIGVACYFGNTQAVQAIIKYYGIIYNGKPLVLHKDEASGLTPFQSACLSANGNELVDYLLKNAQAKVAAEDFAYACAGGNINTVTILLANGAAQFTDTKCTIQIDGKKYEETPLQIAQRFGKVEIADLLTTQTQKKVQDPSLQGGWKQTHRQQFNITLPARQPSTAVRAPHAKPLASIQKAVAVTEYNNQNGVVIYAIDATNTGQAIYPNLDAVKEALTNVIIASFVKFKGKNIILEEVFDLVAEKNPTLAIPANTNNKNFREKLALYDNAEVLVDFLKEIEKTNKAIGIYSKNGDNLSALSAIQALNFVGSIPPEKLPLETAAKSEVARLTTAVESSIRVR
jgi:ankyrin repeat protein